MPCIFFTDNVSLSGEGGLGGATSSLGGGADQQQQQQQGSAGSSGEDGEQTSGSTHIIFATDYCATPDPLRQLLTALCRTAMDQAPDDPLYLAFARIMAKVRPLLYDLIIDCRLELFRRR